MKVELERMVEYDVDELSKPELKSQLDRQIDYYNKIKSRSKNLFTILIAISALFATVASGNLPEIVNLLENAFTLNTQASETTPPDIVIQRVMIGLLITIGILYIMDAIAWVSEVISIRNPEMLLGSRRKGNDLPNSNPNSFHSISPLTHMEDRYKESVRLNNYMIQYMSKRLKYGYASLGLGLQALALAAMTYIVFLSSFQIISVIFSGMIIAVIIGGLIFYIISIATGWEQNIQFQSREINLDIKELASGLGQQSSRKGLHDVIYLMILLLSIISLPSVLISWLAMLQAL